MPEAGAPPASEIIPSAADLTGGTKSTTNDNSNSVGNTDENATVAGGGGKEEKKVGNNLPLPSAAKDLLGLGSKILSVFADIGGMILGPGVDVGGDKPGKVSNLGLFGFIL